MWWLMCMLMGATPLPRLDWTVVNDTVMGGVSTSRVAAAETVVFTGVLSLEQNGGFTSVRAPLPPGTLADATALVLRLRGDGRTYDITLRRADVPLRAGSYRVQVPTEAEGLTEVTLPLSAFRPTSFGRPVQGAPALDAGSAEIDTLGVLLADKQPGPFALEILSLEVVGGATPRAAGHDAVLATLRGAVAAGVPRFNANDAAGCRDLYAQALRGVETNAALTPGERSIVTEALRAAEGQSAVDGAWSLRHAIDTVLSSAP